MTADRETSRQHGRLRENLAVALLCLPYLGAAPSFIVYGIWSEAHDLQTRWAINGPPCPIVDHPSRQATGHKPARTFSYQGVSFSRSFGSANCAAVPENAWWPGTSYPVCQFNNPGAVSVTTHSGRTVFEAPPGQRTTVTVRGGVVRCVVGGWFNL
jgi:hypothetical protein